MANWTILRGIRRLPRRTIVAILTILRPVWNVARPVPRDGTLLALTKCRNGKQRTTVAFLPRRMHHQNPQKARIGINVVGFQAPCMNLFLKVVKMQLQELRGIFATAPVLANLVGLLAALSFFEFTEVT